MPPDAREKGEFCCDMLCQHVEIITSKDTRHGVSADSRKLDLNIIILKRELGGQREVERIRGLTHETKAYHMLDHSSIVTCHNKPIGINILYAHYCTQ